MLTAITAQPARMSCFTYICHSLVSSFRACLRRTEAYDKPTHEPRVPYEGDWLCYYVAEGDDLALHHGWSHFGGGVVRRCGLCRPRRRTFCPPHEHDPHR